MTTRVVLLDNLVHESKRHVQFLRELHALGITLLSPSHLSFDRYVTYWLPLVNKYYSDNGDANNNNNNNNDIHLIPPPDVAWLWHCHRLAPLIYERYCMKEFGRILDPNPPFAFLLPPSLQNKEEEQEQKELQDISTCSSTVVNVFGGTTPRTVTTSTSTTTTTCSVQELWESMYKDVPFFLPADLGRSTTYNHDHKDDDDDKMIKMEKEEETPTAASAAKEQAGQSFDILYRDQKQQERWLLDGFDLIGSAERQATFLWQVSGPRFEQDDFLQEAVDKYARFLRLSSSSHQHITSSPHHDHKQNAERQQQQPLPLVPTYQIDLMWHTHMLVSTSQYNRDCLQIRGARFHHDDSLNDRTPGAQLDVSFQRTAELWKEAYDGEEYFVPGGMYRGEPPIDYYDPQWTPTVAASSLHECTASACSKESKWHDMDIEYEKTVVAGLMAAAGSFSSGKDSNLHWVIATDDHFTSDGRPAFIPASPGCGTAYDDPPMEGYIFGSEDAGVGYYSLETKEAYQILAVRLNRKYQHYSNQINNFFCKISKLWKKKSTAAQAKEEDDALQKLVDETLEMYIYVQRRAQAEGPYTNIGPLPRQIDESHGRVDCTEIKDDADANRTDVRIQGMAYVPFAVLCTAGGCGGGDRACGCGGIDPTTDGRTGYYGGGKREHGKHKGGGYFGTPYLGG